jgi:hypothetical protein
MPSDGTSQRAGLVSFDMVVDAYLASPKFEKLRPNTQTTWRRYLLFACRHLGKYPIEEVENHIEEFFEGLSDRPGIAHVTLAAIRQVERLAKKRRYIAHRFADDIELKTSDDGHVPWTEEQVRFGIAHTRESLAPRDCTRRLYRATRV